MVISDLAIRVLVLFFPGVVCLLIVDALTVHRERRTSQTVLLSFFLGVACYAAYCLFRPLLNVVGLKLGVKWFSSSVFFDALLDPEVQLELGEILVVSIFAIPFALCASALTNWKILHRVARLIRVSKKFGDADVWSFVFNADDVDWVVVRDIRNNLTFEGWVHAFSDVEKPSELLLRDVAVYATDTGEKLYSVGALYLARNREEITIEIPTIEPYLVPDTVKDQEE